MKGLKSRMIIAFLIIIIIPVVLIIAFGTIIATYQSYSILETYEVESDTVQVVSNPMRILSRMTSPAFQQMSRMKDEAPDKLFDEQYLDRINDSLLAKYSFVVVKRNGDFFYVGDEEKFKTVENVLPATFVSAIERNNENGLYVYDNDNNAFLVKQLSFSGSDSTPGLVYIITDVDNLLPQLRMTAIQSVIAFGGVLIITAVILVFWLYRSIISPITVLTDATQMIKQGNLDFTVSGNPDDELGRLCEDFEEMRVNLKDLIDAQKKSQKDSIELIGNISHDLKTPITAIKGYAEGLLDNVADTEDKKERYLKTIYNKAADMAVLVDELAFYSKVDANAVTYDFSSLDVDAYFNDCSEELSLDMELKNVTLKYSNDCKPGTRIMADPEQLKRVISNIMGNSLKYMNKPEGEIELRLKSIGDYVQIEIADNGSGIAAKDLPYIFDRFYRTDESRNSKQGGTGLGLAITKKIVKDHNGQIWALSEYGQGTTIIFTIPELDEEREQEEAAAEVTAVPEKPVRFFGRNRERRTSSEADTDNRG
ncbi:MAG: HAMP domain-containing histidine kinase [Lachnospiraceae bacterium]|nr:HAMP domain-containing histidine kinase [Lachnospiraceae bacterium]